MAKSMNDLLNEANRRIHQLEMERYHERASLVMMSTLLVQSVFQRSGISIDAITADGQRVLKKGDLTKYVKPIEKAKEMESKAPKAVDVPPAPVKPKVKQPSPSAPALPPEPTPAPIKEPERKKPEQANNTTVHGSSLDSYVIPKLVDSQGVNGAAPKSDTAEQPAPATETDGLDSMSLDDLLAIYSLGHEAGKIIQSRLNSYGLKLGGIVNG